MGGFVSREDAEAFIAAVRERLTAAVEASKITGFWLSEPYGMHSFGKVLMDPPELEQTVDDLVRSVS